MDRKIHPIFNNKHEDIIIYSNENDNIHPFTHERIELTQQQYASRQGGFSKSEQSKKNSLILITPYTLIERKKIDYVTKFNYFEQMKFVENLAGLKSYEEKESMIEEFNQLFNQLCSCLKTIQNAILNINFDQANFFQQFNQDPLSLIEIIYKDIKTLEGFHIELVYNSSVRYLLTVLEAQNLEHLMPNFNQFDIRAWQYSCTGHLLKFKVSPKLEKQNGQQKTCWSKLCCEDDSQ